MQVLVAGVAIYAVLVVVLAALLLTVVVVQTAVRTAVRRLGPAPGLLRRVARRSAAAATPSGGRGAPRRA